MIRFKDLPPELSAAFIAEVRGDSPPLQAPDWYLHPPSEPQHVDLEARIAGLAAIWAEARTSFAYWDLVPDLDWDAAFRAFLPVVIRAEEPAAYYRALQRFVALLHEGHSYVVPPAWVSGRAAARPALRIRPVAGHPVVVAGEGLPPGSIITHVDGRPAQQRVAELLELVNASTDHHRLGAACSALLTGPHGSSVRVGATLPNGMATTVTMVRGDGLPGPPQFSVEDLGQGRMLVRINSWFSPEVVASFNQVFPDFDGVTGLVIDQRRNGGGNSSYGDQILSRLIDRPVSRAMSRMPLWWGAMLTFGVPHPVLIEVTEPLLPDETHPRFQGPIVVLTSIYTFSAAEDFCATFRSAKRGLLVGETTGGSTGNPAAFPLPGGGLGAVSATRVEYPGQGPLVGYGLKPDVPTAPTIAGLAAGRDEVLEAALRVLGL